jgi:photosystem II stability/assembly factor-like uncharacterized protein
VLELNGTLLASLGDPQDAARTIGGGIYISNDDGLSWVQSDKGMKLNTGVRDLALHGDTLFAGTGHNLSHIGSSGVFISVDAGNTWDEIGLKDKFIRVLTVTADKQVVAGSNASSFFISEDLANSWSQSGKGMEDWIVPFLIKNEDYLFAVGNDGIWRSEIPVKEWVKVRQGIWFLVKTSGGSLLAAQSGKIISSVDMGETWEEIAQISSREEINFLYELNADLIVACSDREGVFYSSDRGYTWEKYDLGSFNDNNSFRIAYQTPKGNLVLGTGRGTLRSEDEGNTWKNVDEGFRAWSFTKKDHILYAGAYAKGVHISKDDGATWTEYNAGLREGDAYLTVPALFTTHDNSILCGTLGEGMFKLAENDSIWKPFKTGMTDNTHFGIIQDDDGTLYAGSGKGVFKRKE